jgi:hypothetical protein
MTRVSVSAIQTLIQILAGATVPLQLLRAVISQGTTTTPTKQSVQVNRKSAAATVTSFTPKINGPVTDPAASAVGGTTSTGTNASGEGTDSNILWQDVFDFAYGWIMAWSPKEWPFVDATGIVGLKLPVAPAATTFTATTLFEELA